MKLSYALLLGAAVAKPWTYVYDTPVDHFDSTSENQKTF